MNADSPEVMPQSLGSRWIETFDPDGISIQTASGFVVFQDDRHYLVSNKHVLGGLTHDNAYTPKFGRRLPASAAVWFPSAQDPTVGVRKRIELLQPGAARWLKHPWTPCDIAAVELPQWDDVAMIDTHIGETWVFGSRPRVEPGQDVFVIGFPLNRNGGTETLGIWTRASLANEPAFNIDELPRILIDSATIDGLSGSPVFAHWKRGENIPIIGGGAIGVLEHTSAFLGIYSGRIDERSNLGYVWRPNLISEILQHRAVFDPVGDLLG
ncbi:hypothetical protein ASD65_06210 [Microbacterium sp. Root61]|uniref:S1 family peptidase n=1 Tax=Microbacterium sp. Root61 TaxID=1736570 RepID=UPI0006F25988|nr:serine protease [Microbacterium sp. Root61]KRA24063.1 hypothetical protein ASD65_06210 [Microbacterium sp. Root61]